MRNRAIHVLFLATLLLPCARNTSAQVPTSVDNVRITPANPNVGTLLELNKDTIAAASITLLDLLWYEYSVGPDRIHGLTYEQMTTRFDIVGTIDPIETPDPKHIRRNQPTSPLVDALLQNHFRLAAHETSEPGLPPNSPRFEELVIAPGGPKLGPSVPNCSSNTITVDNNHLKGECVSMQSLADHLSRELKTQIVDKILLPGAFAIDLDWSPETDNTCRCQTHACRCRSLDSHLRQSLPTQLGLTLRTSGMPGRVIVVDYVEFPASITGTPPKPDSAQTGSSSH